jgi:superfamily II DNA/RNA helicase
MNFEQLNIRPELLEAISYLGFETATPIQEQVIPHILNDKDVIACAQTGTGKTAAFVLPILNKLIDKKHSSIDTLVIVPTRELAMQIDQQIQGLSYFVSAGSIALYGGGDGSNWETQIRAFKSGVDMIIATPGKLLAHLNLGNLDLSSIKHLVLDEADRMLDMGFIDDLRKIITYLPKERQTLMFSATMAPNIRQLAKNILNHPVEISLSIAKPAEGVEQKVYMVYETQKIDIIKELLKERMDYDSILIFTSTKSKVSEIVSLLKRNGFPAEGISSNLEQEQREEVLLRFSSRQTRILVATDVMSRGIDVKEINMIINYDIPHDAEDYVHRVGRTARVNAKGEAVTFVTQKEMYKLQKIERLIESKVPEVYVVPEEEWKQAGSRGEGRTGNRQNPGKKKFFKKKRP